MHGRLAQNRHVEVRLERLDLPAEGVPAHRDVEPAEALLPIDAVHDAVGEQDEPCTRAVDRQSRRDGIAQRLAHSERARQLVDHARLAARKHEPIDGCQLRGPPDEHHLRAQPREQLRVLARVALQRQHSDARGVTNHARRAGAAPAGR